VSCTGEWQTRFREYNATYFGGQLPDYRIDVLARDQIDALGRIDRTAQQIVLRVMKSADEMQFTLIHEMAHAASEDRHHRAWRAEMRRLAAARAPVDRLEMRVVGTSERLAEQLIYDRALYYLVWQCPQPTLHRFARLFVEELGYARSGAALLRKHLWIASTFARARRDSKCTYRLRSPCRQAGK
jgi:hypothetical protein